jgi:internalin A
MAQDEAYRIAEQKIEEARRLVATELDLSVSYGASESERLTELPESLGRLTQLQSLNLSGNRLTALPESLRQLTQLRSLDLTSTALTALPEWLGQLRELQELRLEHCDLSEIPECVSELTQLQELWFAGNYLTAIPETIRGLSHLRVLWVNSNELTALPHWLSEFPQMQELVASHNQLTDIPVSLAELNQLSYFSLDRNPLNPELAAAYEQGLDGVKRYLRELKKGGKDRYEAKLLILGDGNEGKTCVSRALRGLPFRDQKTTRGVDIVQWKFPHPDDAADPEKDITLNIWDFEGQEISHQTHQFFLSSQALYVLVFKCRDQFLIDRAEYWLDTIRARAPQAKVVIVISQCEERSPHIPLDRIEAQYGELLARDWFFAVGCKKRQEHSRIAVLLTKVSCGARVYGNTLAPEL